MRITSLSVLLLALGISSGAQAFLKTAGNVLPRSEAITTLEQQPSCCESLVELDFAPLSSDFDDVEVIGTNRQVFGFKTGKSYVLAYRLPIGDYSVRVTSLAKNDEIFSPNVLVLDEQYQVQQVYPAAKFKYSESGMTQPDRLEGLVPILQSAGARFLVIMTTNADLGKTTTFTHPERIRARTQSLADPGVADIEGTHSPMGSILLSIEGASAVLDEDGDFVDRWTKSLFGSDEQPVKSKPDSETVVQMASEVPDSSAVKSPAVAKSTSKAVASATATMLPESEAFYNQLIEKSVGEGEIDKALKMVEEAERAGSTTARQTFIDAVKKRN